MESPATKHISKGLLWCVGGLAVTLATYAVARNGGIYIVASGAIVFGFLEFLVGLVCYIAEKYHRSSGTP
jgi:hypothetical protein